MKPAKVAVLGIDSGSRSGAGLVAEGRYIWSRTIRVDNVVARDAAVAQAVSDARRLDLPLMVAMERWRGGGKWGTRAMAGTGVAFGQWKDAIMRAGVPKSRIVTMYPEEWRGPVFGFAAGRSSEEWKMIARRYVAERFDLELDSLTPDEAEAVCQAVWGCTAKKVIDKMPKGREKKL